MSKLWSELLMLGLFAKLIIESAVNKVVHTNVSCNTCGQQLLVVQENQALDIMRLSSVNGGKQPLLGVFFKLDHNHTGVGAGGVKARVLLVHFQGVDITLQILELLLESAEFSIPDCDVSLGVPTYKETLVELEFPDKAGTGFLLRLLGQFLEV